MSAIILDGEPVAARIKAEVAAAVARLATEGIHVGLGTILVGDDVPSARYVAMKHEDCAELGLYSVGEHLPETASQQEVLDVIARFNADPKVSAYLVQLPLPDGLDEEQALLAIDPAKDVDGLHPINLGRLVLGVPGQLPCTPAGIVELLHAYDVPVEGQHVVIIGRGVTIGRPLANLLTLKRPGLNAAVTVVHTGVSTETMAVLTRTGRHRRRRGGPTSPAHAGHGEAGRRRGLGWHHVRGQEADPRRPPRRRRGGRLDHAPTWGSGPHDPCHAVPQCTEGGRTVREVTTRLATTRGGRAIE